MAVHTVPGKMMTGPYNEKSLRGRVHRKKVDNAVTQLYSSTYLNSRFKLFIYKSNNDP